jgi:hypothetical protein
MAVQLSSGLRDHMLVTGSFKSALDGGVLRIYAGTVPATADADISGNTLLCTISNNAAGTGINFETTVAAGVLTKAAAEVWRGQIVANGTPAELRGRDPQGRLDVVFRNLTLTEGQAHV